MDTPKKHTYRPTTSTLNKAHGRSKYYGGRYSVAGLHELPDAICHYLDHGSALGNRNNDLAAAARQCRDSSRTSAEWIEILVARGVADGLSRSEAEKTVRANTRLSDAREPCGPIYQGGMSKSVVAGVKPRRPYALKPKETARNASGNASGDSTWDGAYDETLQGHEGFCRWIYSVFRPEEQISICGADENGKPGPGSLWGRDEIIDLLKKKKAAPSPLKVGEISDMWSTTLGVFVRVNPMMINHEGEPGMSDQDVADHRHLLVEFDEGTKAQQWETLSKSGLPIACVIDSGDVAGKSLHAWVRLDAESRAQFAERAGQVRECFENLPPLSDGTHLLPDETDNPSRYSRIPTGNRGDGKQRLVSLHMGAGDWEEWCDDSEHAVNARVREILSDPLNIVDLSKMEIDESQTLLGDRFLCRGSFMLFVGPTGKGKSSAIVQQDAYWALGRSAFDIKPNGPLKIATLQSENDQGDLTEMSRGSMNGLKTLDPQGLTNEDIEQIANNTRIYHVIESGDIVWDVAEELARGRNGWKPDIIRLDPLQAMSGLDFVKDTRELLAMINRINYITHKYGVAFCLNHHTTKLTFEDIDKRGLTYAAYMSAGGAQLINAARCQLALLPLGDDMPRAFSLIASKRERRLPDWDGRPERFFCQSPHGIRWEDPTDDELEEIAKIRSSKGGRGSNRGQKSESESEIDKLAKDMERQQNAKKAAEEKAQKEAEKAAQREDAIEIVRAEVRQKMRAGEKVSVADAAEIARKIPHAPRTTTLISGLYIKPARAKIDAENKKNEAENEKNEADFS